MATFNKFQVVLTSSSGGTGAKEVADAFLANTPGLALHHVVSQTTPTYDAYYTVLGSKAVLFRVYGSTSNKNIHLSSAYRTDTGSLDVNGEKYAQAYGVNIVSGSSNLVAGKKVNLYSLVHDGAVVHMGGGSELGVSFYNVKNVDDGKIISVAGGLAVSPYNYAADGDGLGSSVYNYPVIQSAADTGYTRAVPVSIISDGSAAVPVAGYVVNPSTVYVIYSNGGLLKTNPWIEISIGGASFVSMGSDSGRYIRTS